MYAEGIQEDIATEPLGNCSHMDVSIAKSFLGKEGEIMVGVQDLFTKEYDSPVSDTETAVSKIPGRTFFARVQYNF